MQTLFDETKNPLFRLMCRLVNEIHAGAKLTRKDILKRITSMHEFNYLEAPEIKRENELVDALFEFDAEGFAQLHLNAPIDNPLGNSELSWLKTMLSTEELKFLLPSDIRARLLARLKDVEPLYEPSIWKKWRLRRSTTPRGILCGSTLRLIVEALSNRKKLQAQEKIFIPCRLQYDPFDDQYWLINWNETRAEKIAVERLTELHLLNDDIPADVEDKLQNFYRQHRAEVSLRLSDTRNAVERCFAAFGACDKQSRLQDDGSYFLTINYCDFDEDEIFNKIISLGAAVTVIAPDHFRQRVIERLRAIDKLYNA